jgi:quinol monooxygenase YgiN
MIARTWRGRVPVPRASAFQRHLLDTGVHDCRRLSGCVSVQVLRRDEGDWAHFLFVSLWCDMQAVAAFTNASGVRPDQAVLYEEDEAFELVPDLHATHYEIVGDSSVGLGPDETGSGPQPRSLIVVRQW